MRMLFNAAALACFVCGAAAPGLALAQAADTSPGWFVPPPQAEPKAPPPQRSPRAARAPVPRPAAAEQAEQAGPGPDGDPNQQAPLPPLPAPPVPALPALPKAAPPPTVVVGVLGVPDVMRQSNAAQIIQRIIGARKEKLREDVDRAQANWHALEDQLQADAPKLSPDQGRARQQAINERVTRERAALNARNRIISEAGQVGLNQIESTLIAVIRQVAESRGMNVVLHRSQVALNMPEFDITEQVTEQLNKLMPTVKIPPEDVDPATLPKNWADPPGATQVSTH